MILNEQRTGDSKAAAAHLDEAISTYSPSDDLGAQILNRFAEARRRREGLEWYKAALTHARRSGERYQTAKAKDGIAHLLHDAGHTNTATRRWREALKLYVALGVPEAGPTRSRLDQADAQQTPARM